MGLGPSLSIRQSQQLVLTPQLQQAIKLLQLSNLELDAFIAEEIVEEPAARRRAGRAATSSRRATSCATRTTATRRRTIRAPTT